MQTIYLKPHGFQCLREGEVLLEEKRLSLDGENHKLEQLTYDIPINGTVYGTLLNYKDSYSKFKPLMHKKPYQSPPKAPILYIKPINTHIAHQTPIPIPAGVETLEMGPTLGVVIGRQARKVAKKDAFNYIKGYIIVNDVRIPHEDFYRPALKEIARDGFCPIGPWIVDRNSIENPNKLEIKVYINGELKLMNNTGNMIRDIPTLIEDVTEFMTLFEGDLLLTGIPGRAPLAKAGDNVRIEIDQIGVLENQILKAKEIWREER